MGENEQGGMLRTVIVVGLIALIAAVITLGVIGLKSNMIKNTDNAVGTVVTTKKPYSVENANVTYKKYTISNSNTYWQGDGDRRIYFPVVGDIPNNSWREYRLVVNASAKVHVRVDVNNSFGAPTGVNDNDDKSKRLLEVYDENGNKVVSMSNLHDKVYLDKDKDYTVVVKYFNNSGRTLIELPGVQRDYAYRSMLLSGTDDGSSYKLNIKSFEAATYDDKYNK